MNVLAPGHLTASAVKNPPGLSIALSNFYGVASEVQNPLCLPLAFDASRTNGPLPSPNLSPNPTTPTLLCSRRAAAVITQHTEKTKASTKAQRETYHDDFLAGLVVLGLVDLDVQVLEVAGERATLALDGDDTSLDIDGDTVDDLALRGGVDPPVTSGGHGS